MWKPTLFILTLVGVVACGDDADPSHHQNNCGGACPPDACGGGATCGDGTCNAGETTQTCAVDCPPPICNMNGTCEGSETTQNCADDCPPPPACNNDDVCDANEQYATCMTDCAAKLRVQNNSSYTIYYLYAKKCTDVAFGANLMTPNSLPPSQAFTLSGIPPGCWMFKASDAGFSHTWQSTSGVNLLPGATYPWTLIN